MPEKDKTAQRPEEKNVPENDKTTQEPEEVQENPGGNLIDPDIILFALPFALLIDILDFVFEIGTVLSIFLGVPLIIWMVWRSGNLNRVKGQIQQIRRSGERKAAQQAAKLAARKALKRGVLVFIVELIPILNLIPFWLIAVIQTMREK